jgi:uncharacterized protein (TIGR02147 family)
MNTWAKRVFHYKDYRLFLADYYIWQKSRNPSFSYRLFAKKAQLSSPNYLKLVIDGKRRITDQTLPKFIRGIGLEGRAAEYLRALVFYQDSKDISAKKHYEQLIQNLSKPTSENKVSFSAKDAHRVSTILAKLEAEILEAMQSSDPDDENDPTQFQIELKINPHKS